MLSAGSAPAGRLRLSCFRKASQSGVRVVIDFSYSRKFALTIGRVAMLLVVVDVDRLSNVG